MYIYAYIYMHACMHVDMYVCVCIRKYTNIYIYIYMHACMYTYKQPRSPSHATTNPPPAHTHPSSASAEEAFPAPAALLL